MPYYYWVYIFFFEKTGNRPPQQLIWMFCCISARIGNSHTQSHARSLIVSFLVLQSGWRHVTFSHVHAQSRITLPETNIAPENRPFQTESSFPTTIFQGLYGYFSFRWGSDFCASQLSTSIHFDSLGFVWSIHFWSGS